MNPKFSLENKTVLITGGGSGIGKAMVTAFARQGARVHLLDFNTSAGTETQNELEAEGSSGHCSPM